MIGIVWRGLHNTILCDNACQRLAAGLWFSPCTPVSSTNKANRHDIAEILLKVELSIVNPQTREYDSYHAFAAHMDATEIQVWSFLLQIPVMFTSFVNTNSKCMYTKLPLV